MNLLLLLLLYLAPAALGFGLIYLAVRIGVRDGMGDFEKRKYR